MSAGLTAKKMPKNNNSFKPGNTAGRCKRRILSEKLMLTKLREHGDEMLDVLAFQAKNCERVDVRVKAADAFLKHTLLQPRDNSEPTTEEKNTEMFIEAGLTLEQAYKIKELMKPAVNQLVTNLIAQVKNEV